MSTAAPVLKARLHDLALPLAVVAVVGMMVVPLPRAVLDVLLTSNLTFALALLISAVYLTEASSFTSLPAVLLLATLMRLGLNISTTRQILSTGEAPQVVQTFGNLVVSGNIVVGAVIFVIITVVQFLVIAKGSERIAEVAARFTLDAMPGKQMSIDADVRAGMMGLEEAREKRRELHRESRLYGALDGAMKFVKGDAIAGLIITIINITAGLYIGVSHFELSIGDAAKRFTLYTIGDGLVSQIPALLVAVAAGVAVSRVEDKEQSFIGREMLAQLGREPQAVATTGGVLIVLSFVPGLPLLPFLIGGLALSIAAHSIAATRNKVQSVDEEGAFSPKVFSAIVLRMGTPTARMLQVEGVLLTALQRLRNDIFEEKGVIVPDIQYDLAEEVPEGNVQICIGGISAGVAVASSESQSSRIDTGKSRFVLETEDTLSSAVIRELRRAVTAHLPGLIDDTHTRILFEVHTPVAEDLINSTVPEIVSVTGLTKILRQLVTEGISIRELRTILQAISETNARIEYEASNSGAKQASLDFTTLLNDVRTALARTISRSLCADGWKLEAWALAMDVDAHFTQAVHGHGVDSAVVDEVNRFIEDNDISVLITSVESRLMVSEILSITHPKVRVVAISELAKEVELTLLGEITSDALEVSSQEDLPDAIHAAA